MLGDVTTDEWMTLLRDVQARSATRARGTMWMLHAVYQHFIDLEVLQTNPLAKRLVKSTFAGKTTKKVRKSQVRTPDLPRFWAGVGRLKQRTSRDAVRTVVLTGWRRSAVLRMRWDELDLEQGVYNVPAGAPGWKGFVGPMALGKYVVELLQERLAHPSAGHSQYVFPARVENGDRLWLSTIRSSVDKAAEKLRYRPTPHDLRRTFVTMAELVLGNLTLVGNLVGHRHGSATGEGDTGSAITAGYVVRNLERERQAATRVQTVLLEAGGELTMTIETWEMFEAAGIEPDAFVLGDLFEADDDDDDEGSGGD